MGWLVIIGIVVGVLAVLLLAVLGVGATLPRSTSRPGGSLCRPGGRKSGRR